MATVEKPAIETAAPPPKPSGDRPSASYLDRRRRFTVDEYYRMAEAGILHEDSRVELIDGDIISMSPIGSRHAACVDILSELLRPRLGKRGFDRVQGPIRLGEKSEPVPDLTIIKPRADHYAKAHPGPGDIIFVIEVMDSSADDDRGVKLGLYARAGIKEVWLVDLNDETIEVYRQPANGAYAPPTVFHRGQSLAPDAFPDVVLGVDAILG
jgi:Uma2 family endonuclease